MVGVYIAITLYTILNFVNSQHIPLILLIAVVFAIACSVIIDLLSLGSHAAPHKL